MKLHRWIIGVFVVVLALGILSRNTGAVAVLYNSTVRIVDSAGNVVSNFGPGLPGGATEADCSGIDSTTGNQVTCTITGAASQTSCLTSIVLSADAPGATTGATVTVAPAAGTIGGVSTFSLRWIETTQAGNTTVIPFPIPLCTSATSDNIVITLPGIAGSKGSINATGFTK